MDMRALYEEVILDHNRNPRNFGRKPDGSICSAHGHNPLCGDEVQVHIKVVDDIIEDIAFEGHGCAISTASASLMTEALKGKSQAEAAVLFDAIHKYLTEQGAADEDTDALGKLTVLGGVKEYPMRVKCATLAWHTLQAALEQDGNPVTTE
jgi:nitrogen fixation NifU-like protein